MTEISEDYIDLFLSYKKKYLEGFAEGVSYVQEGNEGPLIYTMIPEELSEEYFFQLGYYEGYDACRWKLRKVFSEINKKAQE